MKFLIIFLIVSGGLAFGYLSKSYDAVSRSGCAGAGCHTYTPGMVSVDDLENLQVKVRLNRQKRKNTLSAELISSEGKTIDFQQRAKANEVVLTAPQPGQYKIVAASHLESLVWDSLNVEIKSSPINIPAPVYGTSTLKFFPPHPNPAKESVLIRFILPHQAKVEIFLYTLAGKKTSTILNEHLQGGFHSIYWEPRDDHQRLLPKGTYLCELNNGSKKLVQKVSLQ